MHNAPAVIFPVGRSHFQVWLMAALLGCTSLVVAGWSVSVDVVGWLQGLAGGWTVVIAVAMLRSWWRAPQGQLIWDGRIWMLVLPTSSRQVQPELVLDWQATLLLRLRIPETNHLTWVWLERSACAPNWLALRRAVHDPASSGEQATPDAASALERTP